jgi:hypothetical protein
VISVVSLSPSRSRRVLRPLPNRRRPNPLIPGR